jgi:uncharacterized protein YgiM (DUF1202 family)
MPRTGTVPSLFFAVCAIVATHGAFAATKEPPYEAVVESDEAFARCGPGKNFYPTGKLKRGDHVTVRRHDPGGWFMIDPPPGSFSLIQGDDVQREGNLGTVKQLAEGQSPVRIGSEIDPAIDSVYQRQLSSGERIEILGEVTVPRRNGQVQMFKVRPPKGEFRWIEGMNLTPLDQQIQDQKIRSQQARTQQNGNQQPKEQADSDPFAAAPQAEKNSHAGSRSTVSRKPIARLTAATGAATTPFQASAQTKLSKKNAPSAATPTALVDPHSRLDQIDFQFRDTIQRQPATWNLVQIEQAYRELGQQSLSPALRGQLDLRFSAIQHYKQVKAEYDDYFRLVSNTERKDAELAALQNSLDPQDARPAIAQPGQVPPATGPSLNVVPNAATGPEMPVPVVNDPNPQATPSLPAFNPPRQPQTNSQNGARAVGPVLENPVPVPTEPQPEASPRREIRSESPNQSPPAVTPNESGSLSQNESGSLTQEVPTNPPAAPTTQGSTNGAVDTRSQSVPSNDSFDSPTQTRTRTLRNIATPPQGPQPSTVAPTVPPSQPVQQVPNAQPVPSLAAPRQIRPQAAGGLDGAGIVQRAATPVPGGPRHVLLAPNGRILAYLYPDRGVNLDTYVGQSMGIVGPRAYRPELQTDLIVVRRMIPVRLAQ